MFLMTTCTPGKFNDYSKKKLQISTKKKTHVTRTGKYQQPNDAVAYKKRNGRLMNILQNTRNIQPESHSPKYIMKDQIIF